MMKNEVEQNLVKGFNRLSESWVWSPENKNQIVSFGLFSEDGSEVSIIQMEWLPTYEGTYVKLRDIYATGWNIFVEMPEIFSIIGKIDQTRTITIQEFITLLTENNFTDFTEYDELIVKALTKPEKLIKAYLVEHFNNDIVNYKIVMNLFNEFYDFYYFEKTKVGFTLYTEESITASQAFLFGSSHQFYDMIEVPRNDVEGNRYYELKFTWIEDT